MRAPNGAVLHGGPTPRSRRAEAAILLLHGGQESSTAPTALTQPSVVRLLDLYADLRLTCRRTAVYFLRYGVRGWNRGADGGRPAPVTDALWALDAIATRQPAASVTLLGYSMGGRTAFAIAGDERVSGICALAPWLPEAEPVVTASSAQRFVIAHGTADTMTSAPGSLLFARRLRAAGAAVARFEVAGESHSLMKHPLLWHRFAVAVGRGLAGDSALPSTVARALESSEEATLRLPLTRASYR